MHNISYLQALTPMYGILFCFLEAMSVEKKNSLPQTSRVKAKNAYLSNGINYILCQKHMDRRMF